MRIFCLLILSLCCTLAFAQTGQIKGNIKNAAGQPAENINLILKGTGKGTLTDASGDFEFNALAPGHYQLTGTSVGIRRIDRNVHVKADETVTLEIVSEENAQELQTAGPATKTTCRSSPAKPPPRLRTSPRPFHTLPRK